MDDRKTKIFEKEIGGFNVEDLIQEEKMVITMSHKGFIKRTPVADFKSQGKGGVGVNASQLRSDDFIKEMFVASTHSFVLFFTDRGTVFQLNSQLKNAPVQNYNINRLKSITKYTAERKQ